MQLQVYETAKQRAETEFKNINNKLKMLVSKYNLGIIDTKLQSTAQILDLLEKGLQKNEKDKDEPIIKRPVIIEKEKSAAGPGRHGSNNEMDQMNEKIKELSNINETLKNSLNDIIDKLEKTEDSKKNVQENFNQMIIGLKTEIDIKDRQLKSLQETIIKTSQDGISQGKLKNEEIFMIKRNFEEEKKNIIKVFNLLKYMKLILL